MQWSILFAGPAGAGKTQAVSAVSDAKTFCGEKRATDDTQVSRLSPGGGLAVGVMNVGTGDKVLLQDAPSQFNFLWDILVDQAKGVVLLIDHRRDDPVADLDEHLRELRARIGRRFKPIVIGITHVDEAPYRPPDIYQRVLRSGCACSECCPPIIQVDARRATDVQTLLLILTSMMDVAATVSSGFSH
jgi:signal recognition particle receptor subunit beta